METDNLSTSNSRADIKWLTALFGAQEALDQAAEPVTDAVIEAPAPVSQRERALHRAHTYAAKVLSAQEGVGHVLLAKGTAAEVESAQAAHTVAAHQLSGVLAYLPAPAKLAGVANSLANSIANSGESDADFWQRIGDVIGGVKNDYLGVYETAVGKNNDFQKDFTHIISQMEQWQKGDDKNTTLKIEGSKKVPKSEEEMAGLIARELKLREEYNYDDYMYRGGRHQVSEDEGDIRADLVSQGDDQKAAPDGLLDALKDLLEVYKNGPSTVFVAEQGDSQHNHAIAEKWATDLGLPKDAVVKSANDNTTWLVKLDFSPVKTMIESLEAMKAKTPPDAAGKITLSTSSFQAWKVGFDAQAERIKSNSTVMANKLVNAQSIYENLIKVLSSTIAAMMETNKSFLQN
ncbi:MAG: sipD [Herbaspirillum sp.]|nr:sipD [Herbaspirillum sp.]